MRSRDYFSANMAPADLETDMSLPATELVTELKIKLSGPRSDSLQALFDARVMTLPMQPLSEVPTEDPHYLLPCIDLLYVHVWQFDLSCVVM